MEPLQSRILKRMAEAVIVVGCVVAILMSIPPVFSTRPSRSGVRHWEAKYSRVLPHGYSDFRGHWQSQDVGAHIFSFRYPEGADCEGILDGMKSRLGAYRVHQRLPREIALRRSVTYSDPNGFDEFRFVCVPAAHRVYAMLANLDSEMEFHPELVVQLHKIAGGKSD